MSTRLTKASLLRRLSRISNKKIVQQSRPQSARRWPVPPKRGKHGIKGLLQRLTQSYLKAKRKGMKRAYLQAYQSSDL